MKLIRKLDSFRTLTIIVFMLITLACLIIVTFFFSTVKTMNSYIDTAYELKKESFTKEIEQQVERYRTAMKVTSLNPTIRQNIFRTDVSPSQMIDVSSELISIINSTTYLLADQEFIERYVFYSELPTDGKYFSLRENMAKQAWYQDFCSSMQNEYYTFVYDHVKGEYRFLMLQTINDFNIPKPGISSRSACYEVMWIDLNAFFPKNQVSEADMNAYPYLFQVGKSENSRPVYSSKDQYKDYAAAVFQEYLLSDKSESNLSKRSNKNGALSFEIERIPEMDAYMVLLFDETPLPKFFSGNGVSIVIAVLLVVFLFVMFMLLVFYVNFKKRIGTIISILDNFNENEPAVSYQTTNRNDEIGKIRQHTIKMQNRIKTLIEEEYKTKLQNVSAQYEALSANINPHFLYNTLNSIAVTAGMEGAADSQKMILALSDLFRYSADMRRNQVPLADELKNVKDYLHIQEIRYNKDFIFKVSVPEELLNAKVPKLILQPIVENCFKHGFSDQWTKENRQNEIIISAIRENGFLKIYVMDNGRGMDEAEIKRVNHILKGERPLDTENKLVQTTEMGISNVNKRIKLLYKEKCGVEISCEENRYTCVKLQLLYEEI